MSKFFDSTMPLALPLSGTAGQLRSILKTLLVDGYGATAATSITVAGNVATVAYASGHPYRAGMVGQFSGATPAGLNGEKRILSTAANSVTFAAPGIADGVATGSITSKVAAAGWSELFAGTATNVIALKPSAVEATGCVLRLDDTGTTTVRAVGYETMADINTGRGPFPTAGQQPGGLYWGKSNAADASLRAWFLAADDRSFVLWVAPHSSNQAHGILFGFGDIQSDKAGDAYGCLLTGGAVAADVITSATPLVGCLGYGSATAAAANTYLARAHTSVGGAQLAKKTAPHNTGAGYAGAAGYAGNALPYPNGADNSLRLAPVELLVGTAGIRGLVAGVYQTPQLVESAFNTFDTLPGEGAYAGKVMMALRVGAPGAALSAAGTAFVDVTGPWRA